jgi:hypothetical protein
MELSGERALDGTAHCGAPHACAHIRKENLMNHRSELRFLAGCVVCAVASASIQPALAADGEGITKGKDRGNIIHVANNGTDTAACGAEPLPCRSITKAISFARAGDTILVGRGRYGELNGNGVLGDPGEEAAPDCFCMLEINKSVTVRSRDGALATVIDSGGQFRNAVEITADNAQLHGFTITRSGSAGVYVSATRNVTVSRNISTNNRSSDNVYLGDGFHVARGSHHSLISNVSSGNGNGFQLFGDRLTVRGNVSNNNVAPGFVVAGDHSVLMSNTANSNQVGFLIEGTNHLLIRGAAVGNQLDGIQIVRPLTQTPSAPPFNVRIHQMNIFGNGILLSEIPLSNCGIANYSGDQVIATNNFWGADTGPGPDRADQACEVNGTLTSTPYALTEFRQISLPRVH